MHAEGNSYNAKYKLLADTANSAGLASRSFKILCRHFICMALVMHMKCLHSILKKHGDSIEELTRSVRSLNLGLYHGPNGEYFKALKSMRDLENYERLRDL